MNIKELIEKKMQAIRKPLQLLQRLYNTHNPIAMEQLLRLLV